MSGCQFSETNIAATAIIMAVMMATAPNFWLAFIVNPLFVCIATYDAITPTKAKKNPRYTLFIVPTADCWIPRRRELAASSAASYILMTMSD